LVSEAGERNPENRFLATHAVHFLCHQTESRCVGRTVEAALDPDGMSTTVKAVLARLLA
jgi:hypothetical protein